MDTKLNEKNEHQEVAVVNDYIAMMPIQQAQGWYNDFVAFSKSIMKSDHDYGIIPGTPKPSLYKAGAEKLRFVYGLGVEYECTDKTMDLSIPFIDYSYKCIVKSKTGQVLSECEGSCNSMEPKFGYLWKQLSELPEGTDITKLPSKVSGKKSMEFGFAIEKAETTGQYGKPKEYWDMWTDAVNNGKAKKIIKKSKAGKDLDAWEMDTTVTLYRILNPDVIGVKNTIMKMAQKRAFVGAILLATGASEFFTQDIEDMELNGTIYSNEKPGAFEEAEIITDTVPQAKPVHISDPDTKPFVIPGFWYARLEKCKTKEDLDELYNKYKDTVNAQKEIRELFLDTKKSLPKKEVNHA